MIYSPASLLEQIHKGRIIKNLCERELNNPEGVGFDLRLDNILHLTDGNGMLAINKRNTPKAEPLHPDADGFIKLLPKKTYLAKTMETFDLPENLAAQFFPRSTLFRSGILFNSSVLPPGYIGSMIFSLTNNHLEPFYIQLGSRFAHVVLHDVFGEVSGYKGQWQGGRIFQPMEEDQI